MYIFISTGVHMYMCVYIYIHVYIYMCVCVCVLNKLSLVNKIYFSDFIRTIEKLNIHFIPETRS